MLRSGGAGTRAEGRQTKQCVCLCPVGVLNVAQVIDVGKHKGKSSPG